MTNVSPRRRSWLLRSVWLGVCLAALGVAIWVETLGWWSGPSKAPTSAFASDNLGRYGLIDSAALANNVTGVQFDFADHLPDGWVATRNGKDITNHPATGWVVGITPNIVATGEGLKDPSKLRRVTCRYLLPGGSKPLNPTGFTLEATLADEDEVVYDDTCLQGRGSRDESGGVTDFFTVPASVVRDLDSSDKAVNFSILAGGEALFAGQQPFDVMSIPHRQYTVETRDRIVSTALPSGDELLVNTDTALEAVQGRAIDSTNAGYLGSPRVFVVVSHEASKNRQRIIELIAAALFGLALDRLLASEAAARSPQNPPATPSP